MKPFVLNAFKGNLVVGWNLKDDLKALGVEHDRTFDLQVYFKEKRYVNGALNPTPYSLKDCHRHFFKKDSFQCGVHSAIQDARATRDMYFKYLELKEKYFDFSSYPGSVWRTPKNQKKFVDDPTDVNPNCQCKRGKSAKKLMSFVPKK